MNCNTSLNYFLNFYNNIKSSEKNFLLLDLILGLFGNSAGFIKNKLLKLKFTTSEHIKSLRRLGPVDISRAEACPCMRQASVFEYLSCCL